MDQKTMQGLGCIATLILVGYLVFHFAFYARQQSKYAITPGQSQETMIAQAQGALNSLVSRIEPEEHVAATVTRLELSGSELRVAVVEKPKTPDKQQYLERTADLHACEWAERIAMVAPKGVTVRLALLDERGTILSLAKRPPGNKYVTRAHVEARSLPQSNKPSEDDLAALAERIVRDGTASLPGLAPDKDNPRTILHFESLKATNVDLKTKVFTMDSDWEIAWQAGPASAVPAESFFAVALYSSEDRDGKEPHTLVSEMFSTLPIFAGRTKSDLIIFPSGGSFYLGIKSTVPYAVDVRKGLKR